jgi:hypothetical protein
MVCQLQEIPVIVKKGYIVLNSHSSDHAINSVSYGDTLFPE